MLIRRRGAEGKIRETRRAQPSSKSSEDREFRLRPAPGGAKISVPRQSSPPAKGKRPGRAPFRKQSSGSGRIGAEAQGGKPESLWRRWGRRRWLRPQPRIAASRPAGAPYRRWRLRLGAAAWEAEWATAAATTRAVERQTQRRGPQSR